MEKEDILKFTNSIILISKLLITVEDRFFKQKLHDKLSNFVAAFVEYKNTRSSTTSHNVNNFNLLNSINNILDYLENLIHISENNTTPLLVAQRNLLKFKLHTLQKSQVIKNIKGVSETSLTSDIVLTTSEVPVTVSKQRPVFSVQRKKNFGTGTSNKEQIFNYIKKMPDMRTKEIMNEFSALSGRTVKRNLKELTDEGFLKKRSDGVAVYYTCG